MSRSARMRVSDKDHLGHMSGNHRFPRRLSKHRQAGIVLELYPHTYTLYERLNILRTLVRAKAVAAEAAPTIFTYGDQPLTLFQSVYIRIDVGAALAAT